MELSESVSFLGDVYIFQTDAGLASVVVQVVVVAPWLTEAGDGLEESLLESLTLPVSGLTRSGNVQEVESMTLSVKVCLAFSSILYNLESKFHTMENVHLGYSHSMGYLWI